MKLITRFRRLNFWNKLAAIGAICSILGFIGWLVYRDTGTTVEVDVNKSPGANVQTVVNSPNSTLVSGDMITTTNKQIPLPRKLETSIRSLRTINKKLFDVLYILPNDKEAFVPVVERGKKYILFYTNEDLSEIYVPEKYRTDSSMINEACWIVTLFCTEKGCHDNHLERGPKSFRVPEHLSYEL